MLTKEIEVRPRGRMIQYYKDKGYDAKYNQPLTVRVEDLPRKSFIDVEVLCDNCNKVICTPSYMNYLNSIEKFGNYVCKNCASVHRTETFMNKYGVNCPAKLESVLEKMTNTMIAHYGVSYPSQSVELREKAVQTWQQNYGVGNPAKNDEVKKKIVQTCQENFGTNHPAQSPEVREKMSKTLYANSSQKVSRQQRYINNLYQGILNFPVKYYNVDIYLPEDNLTIEYDGGFHLGNVVTGRETIEEFNQKEIIRNNTIKKEGYKQMRIISEKDLLPQDDILLQMLSEARAYFSTYPSHSWIEFNISTSTVRNAEHKDGIPYDFGALRTIKDNDIQNQSDIEQQTNKKGA